MDEAYVVLVAGDGVAQALPFATKAGAEKSAEWFRNTPIADFASIVIDDHEGEGDSLVIDAHDEE